VVGQHVIKVWSSTQVSLALSSGEAEYYGVVRASGVGLGQQALFRDAGLELKLRVWTDSSAAIGTSSRQGLGKLRHVECHSLWLQQRLRRKELELRKIPGEENPADLFTKHLESAAKLEQLISLFNCRFTEGRAESAPNLKKATKDDVHIADDKHAHVRSASQERRENKRDVAALTQMPHLKKQDRMDKEHPAVLPRAELHKEEEGPITEELGDPVPRERRAAPILLRQLNKDVSRTSGTRAKPIERRTRSASLTM
jgi:hypothetical protein